MARYGDCYCLHWVGVVLTAVSPILTLWFSLPYSEYWCVPMAATVLCHLSQKILQLHSVLVSGHRADDCPGCLCCLGSLDWLPGHQHWNRRYTGPAKETHAAKHCSLFQHLPLLGPVWFNTSWYIQPQGNNISYTT